MKKIYLLKELEKYPVFNLKIVKEIIRKNSNYAKLVLHRLKKDELIFEIEKNRYTTKKDSVLIASNIIWPSYISCWSALRYHNLTEQLPQVISVITTRTRRKKVIVFYNTKIIFTKVKPRYFFGYRREKYQNFNIFLAEKEKALIDSALLKKISFSEISSIVEKNMDDIDTDLLVKYLLKIKNKTLIKRFGFLLEKLGIDKYTRLRKFIDFKYIALDYALPKEGKKDRKWKVIENVRS
jgi:predicted transcriptional regulator of viral defense system